MNPHTTIPFAKVEIGRNELKYLKEVLKCGWLTTSSKAFELERLFAEYVGARYACAVNSCTAGLHLSVEAAGIKPGDKVMVPSLTFTASAEILRYIGADPVLTDVDYDTCLVSPEIIKETLAKIPGIKALILVHYGGQAPVMTTPEGEGIIDICRKNKISVIEDAAHAFPTKYNEKFIGSFGDLTCFSFYANKTITTGEGGMVVTDDEELCKRIKIMRLHGINRDIWSRFTDKTPSWEYDVVAPGFKYNMPDVNASIGLAQLEQACNFREKRQHCAEYYYNELKGISVIDLPVCKGPLENNSWHLFPIKIKPEAPVSRNEFINLMCQEGIGTSVHYKPLHRMTYYRDTYKFDPADYPNTEKIWNGTVSLPIYPALNNKMLRTICNTIKSILG